jgi:hypothetical protein
MRVAITDPSTGVVLNIIGASSLEAARAVYPSCRPATDADVMPSTAPLVPEVVTMAQARLALLAVGKLSAVDAAIAALPEPQRSAAQVTWEFNSEVRRGSALIAQLGPVMGLSSAQIDELFVQASRL